MYERFIVKRAKYEFEFASACSTIDRAVCANHPINHFFFLPHVVIVTFPYRSPSKSQDVYRTARRVGIATGIGK